MSADQKISRELRESTPIKSRNYSRASRSFAAGFPPRLRVRGEILILADPR
jgi:hypothetical protein